MAGPYKVIVVTTSRADYGIYTSVLERFEAEPKIDLSLIVGGTHLSPDFGMTVNVIENDGFQIAAKVDCVPIDDQDISIAETMGQAVTGFAKALNVLRPDMLIVLGDRYEMHSAALAALPLRIPVAHIHGGEETEGAMDNSLRHSITKLSHLHLCSTALAASRVMAMGEDAQCVSVSGAPALDSILACEPLSRAEWAKSLGVPDRDFLLLTYHPVTLTPEKTLDDFDAVWRAVKAFDGMCVITLSNADTCGRQLNDRLTQLAHDNDDVFLVNSMGALRYYSAMHHAKMMVGNSSSGIIEAASFGLPVINIGDRQKGREISPNVLQVPTDTSAIQSAMKEAQTPLFQKVCAKRVNVYGDGHAAAHIVAAVLEFLQSERGVRKHFSLVVEAP